MSTTTSLSLFSPSNLLPRSFFERFTVDVAKDLLGKILLVTDLTNNISVAGRIVEVEAYRETDPASHCYKGPTTRCAIMFGNPGYAYIYSMHGRHCLNFITEPSGTGAGVLIRAVEPIYGLETMQVRRPVTTIKELTNGPGKLCQAFGITIQDKGQDLLGPRFQIFQQPHIMDNNNIINQSIQIKATPRIGISVAKDVLWRFVISDSIYLSKYFKQDFNQSTHKKNTNSSSSSSRKKIQKKKIVITTTTTSSTIITSSNPTNSGQITSNNKKIKVHSE
jgi:DNA-3-methyladenine glycosylase